MLVSKRHSNCTKTHLLITAVFPPKPGGSGRWFSEIYPRSLGSKCVVVTEHLPENGTKIYNGMTVVPMSLEMGNWSITSAQAWVQYVKRLCILRRVAKNYHVYAVHAGRLFPEGWLAWLLSLTRKLPYIVYVHGEELGLACVCREYKWMATCVFRNARHIVANCNNTAEYAQKNWQSTTRKIVVLNPGVDTNRFKPAPKHNDFRQQVGWENRRVILTVGRLEKRKGHDMMLRAMVKLAHLVPDVLYAIVGSGEEYGALLTATKNLGLEHSVRFYTTVTDEELPMFYQNADVFVLPNRTIDWNFEGFGIVLLESQACGVPVVAGDSGGTKETMILGETGYIVNCEDPEQIAGCVAGLLLDDERRVAMGRTAREWICRRFSWDNLAKEARAIFSRL